MSMTGYNARLTINGKEIPLAKVAMTPAVDPALEAAASALRADLAARGIPADELPETVMLALAVQQERINQLHTICRALHDRLERVENAAAPLLARTPTDSRPGFRVRQVIDEALSRAQSDPATYQPNPDGRYPLCLPRIGQADVCQRCGETIDPDIERPCPWVPREGRWGPSVPGSGDVPGTLRGPISGPTRLYGTLTRALTDPEGAQLRAALASGRASDLVGLPIMLQSNRPERAHFEVRDDLAGPGSAPPPEAPRFRHDCPDCEFLGRSEGGVGDRDLYWCRDTRTPIAVYGDAPGQFDRVGPYLAEAHRRAVARGLVGGAGAGEGG